MLKRVACICMALTLISVFPEKVGAISVCVLLLAAVLPTYIKGKPVFELFTEGAKAGLQTAVQLLPTLLGMITAIAMLRASGLFDLFTGALAPWLEKAGVHADLIPLMLLRPFSGSGSFSPCTFTVAASL